MQYLQQGLLNFTAKRYIVRQKFIEYGPETVHVTASI